MAEPTILDPTDNTLKHGAAVPNLTMSVGTADNTLADVGASFNQGTLNNNFRDLGEKLNLVLAALRSANILAR